MFRPPFVDAFCVDEVACAAPICNVGGFYLAVLYEFSDFLFAHTVGFGYFADGVRFFNYCLLVELLFDSVEPVDDVFDGVLFFTH